MDANFRTGEQRGGLRSMHTGEGGKKWGQTCACLDLHILSVPVKLSLSLSLSLVHSVRILQAPAVVPAHPWLKSYTYIHSRGYTLWIRRTQKQLRGRSKNPAAYSDLGAYI